MSVRRVVAAAIMSGMLAAPATVVPAEALPQPNFVFAWDSFRLLSPNGDGRGDRAVIRFEVLREARISIELRDGYGAVVVGPVRLGVLEAGEHLWRWDGRLNSGKVVPGIYRVSITATRNGRTGVYSAGDVWVGKPTEGRFVEARRTVYPRAIAVHDRVQIVFLREDYEKEADVHPSYGIEFRPERMRYLGAILAIRDSAGRLVYRQERIRQYVPSFSWDGRSEGKALPPGIYRARLMVRNPWRMKSVSHLRLRVSGAQLQREVHSQTLPAGQWPYYSRVDNPGDLGETFELAPDPSTRFPGGLTFASGFCCAVNDPIWAVRRFRADVPFASAPVDRFRVTATGGPTVEDDSDVGYLWTGPQVTTPTGDASTTSAWAPVTLGSFPNLPDDAGPMSWRFSTADEMSYDVATFTVEYRHYVPVS